MFSCSAGTPSNPARVTRFSEGGGCGGAQVTINVTPTFNNQTYSTLSTSGFYVTGGRDTVSAFVQIVWDQWSQGASLNASMGFYSSVYGTPFYDSAAQNNSLNQIVAGTINFNSSNLDAGSAGGRASHGDYYFGGLGTLTTCRATITQAPVIFYAHVTAPLSLSSISPSAFTVGNTTQFTINGSGLGNAGNANFSGATFSVPYTGVSGSNGTQATATVTPTIEGAYTVSVKETQDVAGFGFQKTGAQGQAPQSNTSVNATVDRSTAVGLTVTSSLNQFNNPSTPLSQISPTLRLPLGLNCAMIDGTPQMPQISARVVDAQTNQPVASGTAQFNLNVQFSQMTGTQTGQAGVAKQYSWDLIPAGLSPPQVPANTSWNVQPSRVLGGTATINWTYNGIQQQPFSFCIQSYNPSYADAYAALDSGIFWFRKNVANHETSASQVCEPGRNQAAWCSGGYWGQPVWGYPQGYGMLQLDPPQGSPPLQVLGDDDAYEVIWNWRANLVGWDNVTGTKAGLQLESGTAYGFWADQVDQWRRWNATPGNLVVPPLDQRVEPPNSFPTCTFDFGNTPDSQVAHPQGTYWLGDAILMKQLGGAPMNFVSFLATPGNPRWSFCHANSVNQNVVGDFCTCQQAGSCQRNLSYPNPAGECVAQ